MNIVWLFVGLFIGGIFGVVFMCLLQINRNNSDDNKQ